MKENLNERENEISGCILQMMVKALYRLTNIGFLYSS